MRVRGFLHGCVVPLGLVLVVRPGNHVVLGEEMILVRRAAERVVDDRHGFGARDELLRAEGAVRVAVDDAHVGQRRNGVVVPLVGGNVGVVVRLAPELVRVS